MGTRTISPLTGCIGFASTKSDHWYSFVNLIKFFTGSRWNHAFVCFDPIHTEDAVIEASLSVQVVPFDKYYRLEQSQQFEVYAINADDKAKHEAIEYLFDTYAGEQYGFSQVLWFVWRWLNGLIGRKLTKEKNWFGAGKICSELVFDYLTQFPDYAQLLSGESFDENTCAPADLYGVVTSNPQMFHLVESK